MEKKVECKQFNELKETVNSLINALEEDAQKYYNKDNAAAGVRLRKGYKAIKSYVEGLSKATMPKKNGKPSKKTKKVDNVTK